VSHLQENWRYSDEGRLRRVDGYFNDVDKWIRGETQVLCCGDWLSCCGFTNTCSTCGADFNMSGQRLAPREQWGEETGESVADILSIDMHTPDESLDG
jgi:hypothetical protein